MQVNSESSFDLVRREVGFAFEHVAFFRKHMERVGLEPGDISAPTDLLRLPPTRKADYRRNFPAGVLVPPYTLSSRHVMRFQSSGTEGDRLVSVVLSYNLARRQATCLEFNSAFKTLWRPGLRMRTCRYAAPNCSDVECSNPNSTLQSRLLPDRTLVLPVYHDLLTTPPDMVHRALDEIARYDPHLLFIDPTHFAFLTRAMREAGRFPHRIDGFCIQSGYTLCTRVARRQIRECYGGNVPFADMLGMSEFGYLGFECSAGRLHINSTDYYLEFVRDGAWVQPGELGELIITPLEDRLSPHIRYATGDLYRLDLKRCPCGNPAPVVSAEGRAKNVLRRGDGGVLTPGELDKTIGEAAWLDMYRMVQLQNGSFLFEFLPNEAWTAHEEADLAAKLRDELKTLSLKSVQRSYLPADRGGKFISCISLFEAGNTGGWS